MGGCFCVVLMCVYIDRYFLFFCERAIWVAIMGGWGFKKELSN